MEKDRLKEFMLEAHPPEKLKDPIKIVKKGGAKLFILFMLKKKPMHGYAIIKTLNEEAFFHFATPGRIYPLLREMEDAELVTGKVIKGDKRMVKEYRVTKKGKELLEAARTWFNTGLKGEFHRYMVK